MVMIGVVMRVVPLCGPKAVFYLLKCNQVGALTEVSGCGGNEKIAWDDKVDPRGWNFSMGGWIDLRTSLIRWIL